MNLKERKAFRIKYISLCDVCYCKSACDKQGNSTARECQLRKDMPFLFMETKKIND